MQVLLHPHGRIRRCPRSASSKLLGQLSADVFPGRLLGFIHRRLGGDSAVQRLGWPVVCLDWEKGDPTLTPGDDEPGPLMHTIQVPDLFWEDQASTSPDFDRQRLSPTQFPISDMNM